MRRLTAALLFAAPLLAQHDPVLTGIPQDATNVFVLRDPLPHVDAFLKSKAMAEVGEATKELQQQAFGGSYSPAQLARMLTPFRDFVPTEVVVAMPPSSMHALSEIGAALLCGFLSMQPIGDDELEQELRDDAAAHIAKIAMPAMYVRVRARSERAAEGWFDSVVEALEGVPDDGFVVTAKESSVDVAFEVGKLGDGGMAERLRSIGLDPAPVERLTGSFTIALDGDALVLRAGSLGAGQLVDAQLGALWMPKGDQLLFGMLDHEDALEVYTECFERVSTVQEAMDDDEDGVLLKLSELVGRFADLTPKVVGSLVVRDGIDWVIEHDFGGEELEIDAPRPELLRCLALENASITIVNLTLDVMVTSLADALLGELAERADKEGVLQAYQAILDRGAGLFDFFGGEESSVFEMGCVFAVRESVLRDVRMGGNDLGELPFPAFAIVAPATDAAAGTRFGDRLGELLGEAFGAEGSAKWSDVDLGLGAPTRTLAWQRFLPEGTAVGSGLELHHVQKGQWLVLSSDARLSKDLLDRLAAKDLPPGVEPGLLARNGVTGEQMQTAMRMFSTWIERLGEHEPSMRFTKEIATFFEVVGQAVRYVDRYEDVMTVRGSVLREQTIVKVRSTPGGTETPREAPATGASTKGEAGLLDRVRKADEESKLEIAAADVKSLYDLARLVHVRDGRIPTMQDLTKKDRNGKAALDRVTPDPWGHDYLIRATGPHRLEVRSMGPDGKLDTDDDVVAPDRR